MYVAADRLEEDYLPTAMPGRERQLQRLSSVLKRATKGEPADSCWEIGPSGVGNTSTARFLLRKLHEDWVVDSVYEHYGDLSGSRTRQSVVNYREKLDEYDLIECVDDGWVVIDETLAAPLREPA